MSDNITLSSAVQRIKESPTLAVTAKASLLKSQGIDIIGLAAGEPDFDTPEFIKQGAIQLSMMVKQNIHRLVAYPL